MSSTNRNSEHFEEAERNQLVVIDLPTLQNLISRTIKNVFENLNDVASSHPTVKSTEDGLMTMEEVTKFLKVSKVTIHNWKKKGIIKSHKIGRKLYFKKAEIESAIRLQKYSLK